MSQAYITLVVSLAGMLLYGFLAIKAHKGLKADELLTFALWCGAIVAGIYMVVAAFKLSGQAGQETNGLYVGIFGVYLVLLSIQTLRTILRGLTSKPSTPASPLTTEEKKPPQEL